MCGIVGYIGNKEALPILMNGLYRLEYRGYDSAGVAVMGASGKVKLAKTVGRVADLDARVQRKIFAGTVGIAHTRWATHGKPSEKNAHPHTDCLGNVHVVHNGIIENHAFLAGALKREGHEFSSATDSEVLAHLIERALAHQKRGHSLQDAVCEALGHVKGTFGIAVLSSADPHKIVVARRGSPLLIGVADGACFVASDASAVVEHTKHVVYLNDNELGVLGPQGYEILTLKRKHVERSPETIPWSVEESQKGGYAYFMEKEIYEIPDVVRDALRGRVLFDEGTARFGGLDAKEMALRKVKRILITACGTSYYAGLVGKYMIEECAGIPVDTLYASEFRYANPVLTGSTLVLVISQSGETADTLQALREAKRRGAETLAIVNVVGSTIAREAGIGIYNHAGPEIGVASTKAFVSQLTVLALLSVWFARHRHASAMFGKRLLRELQRIPKKAERVLVTSEHIKKIALSYAASQNFLFLGRKYNWPTALEGALKLKEISYIHAEGYAAGEMKHGPIALIDASFPSFVLAPSDSVYEKVISNIQELRARGGKVVTLATEGNTEIASLADDVLYIPSTMEMLTPLLAVIPLQLFAYYVAMERGCDVDKPRNLAKSVTVE